LSDGVSPLRILVAELSDKDHEKQATAKDEAEQEREGKELRDEQSDTHRAVCKSLRK